MESLLESAKTYVEVLQNCGSGKVATWEREDLERAVNWAEYFKRVHSRIQKKMTLVRKFDVQLREIGSQIGMRFGRRELSSEFLGESLPYLLTTLLENPALPDAVKQLIQQKHAANEHLKLHAEKTVHSQTLLNTLTAIHSKLTTHLPPHVSPFLTGDPQLVASALALQDEVEWILSRQHQHTTGPALSQHLYSKLGELARQETGMEVILYSTCRVSCSSSSSAGSEKSESSTSAPRAILSWLEDQVQGDRLQAPPTNHTAKPIAHSASCKKAPETIAERLWALSPTFLAGISAQNVEFYRLFYKLLASRVNHLQTEIIHEFESSNSTKNDMIYIERLVNEVFPYFKALLTVDPKVTQVTVALITSQVEETAAKVLAAGMKASATSTQTEPPLSDKHPTNLWRKVLAIGE